MTEEERAALYREQVARREQWARDNAITLRGDADAAQEVRDAWSPVVEANRERRQVEPLPEERHDRDVWTPA